MGGPPSDGRIVGWQKENRRRWRWAAEHRFRIPGHVPAGSHREQLWLDVAQNGSRRRCGRGEVPPQVIDSRGPVMPKHAPGELPPGFCRVCRRSGNRVQRGRDRVPDRDEGSRGAGSTQRADATELGKPIKDLPLVERSVPEKPSDGSRISKDLGVTVVVDGEHAEREHPDIVSRNEMDGAPRAEDLGETGVAPRVRLHALDPGVQREQTRPRSAVLKAGPCGERKSGARQPITGQAAHGEPIPHLGRRVHVPLPYRSRSESTAVVCVVHPAGTGTRVVDPAGIGT